VVALENGLEGVEVSPDEVPGALKIGQHFELFYDISAECLRVGWILVNKFLELCLNNVEGGIEIIIPFTDLLYDILAAFIGLDDSVNDGVQVQMNTSFGISVDSMSF
jgi:hypothetical protein